ncbi:hypothetical protein [Sphingomonas aracearum]|uniref:Uncharacterized protein n=1 Tax=Sphingomonas aracearum TaxID=2283317 RepID=A0A369VRU2_9SPHN|nr:hypothetical protein [Sphingomonas aracearum]RDE04599.1 hypothetical protein DVW87_13435 [Sphingomonas aracearum]
MSDRQQWARVRPGYWFAPRLFGWGATPVTWEGWLLTLGGAAAIVALAHRLEDGPARTMSVIALVALLAFVAWRKTDGAWRWRWGDPGR